MPGTWVLVLLLHVTMSEVRLSLDQQLGWLISKAVPVDFRLAYQRKEAHTLPRQGQDLFFNYFIHTLQGAPCQPLEW